MKIAVIGAGRVGSTLGGRFADLGEEVVYGVRDPARHAEVGATAAPAEAVRGAGLVLLALPWGAVGDVVRELGDLGDAVLVDATNPLADGMSGLVADPSGAEVVQALATGGRVVKAFNTTGAANMADPGYGGAAVWMPVAGDDPDAKEVVIYLAEALGFDATDVGPLTMARRLEELALLWVRLAYVEGNGPDFAFGLLRRGTSRGG